MNQREIARKIRGEFGENYYSAAEVADLVGVSLFTLKRWIKKGRVSVPDTTSLGESKHSYAYAFSGDALQEVQRYARKPLPGRRK